MTEYDFIHDWYVQERSLRVGVSDVESIIERLPPHADVLDLGCGTGVPLAQLLAGRGLEVFGVDSSVAMIATFRKNIPSARSELSRMEDVELPENAFDMAIAWGSLFHLAVEVQEL